MLQISNNCLAGFDGSVCVWDVSLNANNEPHLLHTWQAHPGTEILAMVHDAMKNVIVTAANDNLIKVSPVSTGPEPLIMIALRHEERDCHFRPRQPNRGQSPTSR